MIPIPPSLEVASGESLAAMSHRMPVLLVCLRHPGCIFTSQLLDRLGKQRSKLEEAGLRIVLLHLDPEPDCFASALKRHGLDGIAGIADPKALHYAALGLRRGKWCELVGLRAIVRGALAFFRGHRQGKIRADVRQLAGVFLLRNGVIEQQFFSRDSADIPDFLQFVHSAA